MTSAPTTHTAEPHPPADCEARAASTAAPSRVQPLPTVGEALRDALVALGARLAFGVSGGAVASLWSDLAAAADLRLVHCQHESGAAFAATEASLASDRPALVVTTTGPGLTNALTGLCAARNEGARVILLSAVTPARLRERGPSQRTDHAAPLPGLFTPGPLFDLAAIFESPTILPALLQRLADGLARPGGFIAHLGLPADIQRARLTAPLRAPTLRRAALAVTAADLDALAERLRARSPTLVVGHDARHAAAAIRELVDRTGARVLYTPRGKGIIPDDHPHLAGGLGLAADDPSDRLLDHDPPHDVLVLGSRLGESSTAWSPRLAPRGLLVHVHPDPAPLAGPYPECELLTIHADVGAVVDGLLARIPPPPTALPLTAPPIRPPPPPLEGPPSAGVVRPRALLDAIQREVVDRTDTLLMAEVGNAFAWALHHLRLPDPRLRVSVDWGSLGHFAAGVIGPVLAGRGRALALVGDGAMLMGNELATAVRLALPAIWVVLNDRGYGMCRHGMSALGLGGADLDLPPVDFARLALSHGAAARRIDDEGDLPEALTWALAQPGPVVLDVRIDRDEPAPIQRRLRGLARALQLAEVAS